MRLSITTGTSDHSGIGSEPVLTREARPVLLPPVVPVPPQWLAETVDATTDMALWQLLILMCVALPIGTSVGSARYANAGAGGYALAIVVGLVVGMGFGWTMWKTHKPVVNKLQRLPSSGTSLARQEWYFRAFYLAKMLWTGFAGFLGFWLSSAILRVAF